MAFQSLDDTLFFVIVDAGNLDSRGEGSGAVVTGNGGDAVLACFKDFGDNARGEAAGCLG